MVVKIELRSTRTDINASNQDGGNVWRVTTALEGNPALFWQPFMRNQMMRLSSDDWSDAAIHELSHGFDNNAWIFDSEFLADFKEYYIVENLGAYVYRFDTNKYYSGSQFANFFRTDQWESYDNTFAKGYYSSRGLTSVFIRIKDTIGWQPFKDTFRYFNTLTSSQIPSSSMDKFNLFIGKLSEYANYDVRTLLTSSEINIIQNQFGGTIAQNYDAQVVSDTIPIRMEAGKSYNVSVTVKNTGLNTWSETKLYRLGAIGDSDPFTSGRKYFITGESIAYGQTKTFNFTMTAPTTVGTYTSDWKMVRDGYSWFGNTLVSKQVNVFTQVISNIYVNTSVDVNLAAGLFNIYKFTPSSSATYSIFTGPYGGTGISNDTYLEVYADSGLTNRIAYNDDGAGNLFSKIDIALTGGTAYYVKLRPYDITSGIVHARLTVTTKVVPIQTLSLNVPVDTQVAQSEYNIFKFTPTTDGLYKFYTGPYGGTGSSSDTYLELYSDQNLTKMITYNDDYLDTIFSLLQYDLNANTSYYLKFKGYNNNSSSARLTVNKICDAYSAQIISNTIPIQMEAGKSYKVSLTVKNTGSRSWTEANAYRLGALGDSNLFAATRQYLSSNEAIAYGQTKTFSFIMTAPSTGGTYTTNWRMVRDGYSWFGDTLSKNINVEENNIWYKMTVGNKTVYIKEPESDTSNIEARVCQNGSDTALVYNYVGEQWISNNIYAYLPGSGGGVGTASVGYVSTLNIVNDVIVDVTEKVDEIKEELLNSLDYDKDAMTSEDWDIVTLGIVAGVVDSTFPEPNTSEPKTLLFNKYIVKAVLFKATGQSESDADNNYYYIKSKINTEFAIMIAARIVEAGSYTAAIGALKASGVSFTGGLAVFAGTGGLGAPISLAIEVEAAGALATSGVCAIAGVAVGKVAGDAESAMKGDDSKFSNFSEEESELKKDITEYKKTFYAVHPELEGKVIVHHSIEQQVLKKYPGLFSETEINAYERLRGIPKSLNSDIHLSKIRKEWNKFYKEVDSGNIACTKKNFLNKASEIDRLFGDSFSPSY